MAALKKRIKKNKDNSVVNEPFVGYKRKRIEQQLLVTPKRRKSLTSLKNFLDKMDEIEFVEIVEGGEVRDDELLKRMKKNLKSGYASREDVMQTLRKVIDKK